MTCPNCKGELKLQGDVYVCNDCPGAFTVDDRGEYRPVQRPVSSPEPGPEPTSPPESPEEVTEKEETPPPPDPVPQSQPTENKPQGFIGRVPGGMRIGGLSITFDDED